MKPPILIGYSAAFILLAGWTAVTTMRPHRAEQADKPDSGKALSEADEARGWSEGKKGSYPEKWELASAISRYTPGTVGDFHQDKEKGDFSSSEWLKGSVPGKPILLQGNFAVSNIEAVSTPYTGAAVLLSPLDNLPGDASRIAVWVYVEADKQEVIDQRQELLNAGRDSKRIVIGQSTPLAVMASNEEGGMVYFHALSTGGKGLASLLGMPARSGGFPREQTSVEKLTKRATANNEINFTPEEPEEAPKPTRQEYDHPAITAEPLNLVPGVDKERILSLLDIGQVDAATMANNMKALNAKETGSVKMAVAGSLRVARIDEVKTDDGVRFFAKLESNQLNELELWSVLETTLNNSKQLREMIHTARSNDREGSFSLSRNAVFVPVQKEGNRVYVRDITGSAWPLEAKTEAVTKLPGIEDKTSLIIDSNLWRAAEPKNGMKNAAPGEYFTQDFAIKINEIEEEKPGRVMKCDLLNNGGSPTGEKITIILADGITNGQVGSSLRYSSLFRFQKVSDDPLVVIDRTEHN